VETGSDGPSREGNKRGGGWERKQPGRRGDQEEGGGIRQEGHETLKKEKRINILCGGKPVLGGRAKQMEDKGRDEFNVPWQGEIL